MPRIGGAGVVLECPEGGYIVADAATEYKNLKTATGIVLAIAALGIVQAATEQIHREFPEETIARAVDNAVQVTIESLPEEVQPAAWDAWITLDRSLI